MLSDTRPSFLLITVDCLRADHVSCFGYGRPTTPHLDRLAQDGVAFSQAIAHGSCTRISFSSILSSTYPSMFGGFAYLSDERPVVAEILREAGYATAAFGSNPYLSTRFCYHKGFDFYDQNLVPWNQDEASPIIKNINRLFIVLRGMLPYLRADALRRKALRWLEGRPAHRPFFLWVHFMDVHEPYRPPRPYARLYDGGYRKLVPDRILWQRAHARPQDITDGQRAHLVALYDGEINFVDREIGRLLEQMGERDLLENTLVVVAADHGDEFAEHGEFGHRFKLYDELIRVPLIFWSPDLLPQREIIPHQVRLIDLVPTALDLLNVHTELSFEGTSLLPYIQGQESWPELAAISETSPKTGALSLRTGQWKLIWHYQKNHRELYDLQKDAQEHHNIADRRSDVVTVLEPVLRAHLDRVTAHRAPLDELDVDAEVRDRWRALGYLD